MLRRLICAGQLFMGSERATDRGNHYFGMNLALLHAGGC